jgi:hypothetical protein
VVWWFHTRIRRELRLAAVSIGTVCYMTALHFSCMRVVILMQLSFVIANDIVCWCATAISARSSAARHACCFVSLPCCWRSSFLVSWPFDVEPSDFFGRLFRGATQEQPLRPARHSWAHMRSAWEGQRPVF